MNFEINRRNVLTLIGAIVIMFFAGYGVGNIGAKTYKPLTEVAPATTTLR